MTALHRASSYFLLHCALSLSLTHYYNCSIVLFAVYKVRAAAMTAFGRFKTVFYYADTDEKEAKGKSACILKTCMTNPTEELHGS